MTPDLPNALTGQRIALSSPVGPLSYYRDGEPDAAPLLLVHSINAAGSAYEMKPVYDHFRSQRAVYAIDLPGFLRASLRSPRGARGRARSLVYGCGWSKVAINCLSHGNRRGLQLMLSLSSRES